MVPPPSLDASARRRAPGSWVVGILLGLITAPILQAASPRDELLRFVPEDTAFCVVFQDLHTHWTTLHESPFAEQFRRSPFVVALQAAEEVKKLSKLEKILEKQLGINWAQVRDDIFGESVVFAYRSGPVDKPDQEQILLLLRSRNGKTLSDLLDHLNEAQRKSGQLKDLQTREYKGIRYHGRVETRETSYYYLRGPILLVSSQEEMLKQALDCDRDLPDNSEPPLARQLKQLETDRALMTLWLNPRAFDTVVEARAARAGPAEAEGHKTVARCWKALDGLALSLQLDRDLSLALAVRARLEQMPPATRKFLAQSARPGELSRLFPEDPLLAFAARLDLVSFLDSLSEFLPAKRRQSLYADLNRTLGAPLGKDLFKEVLPHLGPDLGVVMVAPAAQEKGPLPHTMLALRVGVGDESAPVDKTLLSAVQFLGQLLVFGHNSQHPEQPLYLKNTTVGGREIRYLTGEAFPLGLQPACALQDGYLLLASSPEVIRRFAPTPLPANPSPTESFPLVRVSIKAWRAYLKERRAKVIETMIAKKELTAESANEKLNQLQVGLDMLERIELRQKTSKDLLVLTFSLQPAQPFKK